MHHGAVILFTDSNRELFLLQQKDDLYKHYPYGFSLFGGAVEAGESPIEAAHRELREELDIPEKFNLTEIFSGLITPEDPKRLPLTVTFFEVCLPIEKFKEVTKIRVKEGRGSVVVSRQLLRYITMVYNIEQGLYAYLQKLA